MPHTRPQRFPSTSPPGALLKRAFDTTKRLRLKEVGERDPIYLEMIRKLPCLSCTVEPCRCAAHVRRQSAAHGKRGGTQKKPADKWALPLCNDHHVEQHQVGELKFWYDLNIDPLLVCTRLYAARGNLVIMRSIVFAARAGMLS
jgi:hypothetical protein